MTPITSITRSDPETIVGPAVFKRPLSTPRIAGRPARILLAEDDREMRELLAATLRADGYEVIESSNGFDMLQEIEILLFSGEAVPMDLIVSDERMPGMLGLEALAHVRQAEWPTPFILITGFGDRETHAEADRLGASAVFDKPFDLDDLRWKINELLGGRTSAAVESVEGLPVSRRSESEGRG
jgi:CheY-like chemotaxis protein